MGFGNLVYQKNNKGIGKADMIKKDRKMKTEEETEVVTKPKAYIVRKGK